MPPFVLDVLEAGQRPTLEIRGDCKTTVDWIHAKLKTRECTVAKTQNILRDWWGPSTTADCQLGQMSFVNTTKKRICGRTRARRDVWMNLWALPESCGQRSVVSVGFWDGSCDNGNCGARKLIMACSELQGWFPIHKKCGPVSGQNSLEGELGVVVC